MPKKSFSARMPQLKIAVPKQSIKAEIGNSLLSHQRIIAMNNSFDRAEQQYLGLEELGVVLTKNS
jgi:hypothetical protein